MRETQRKALPRSSLYTNDGLGTETAPAIEEEEEKLGPGPGGRTQRGSRFQRQPNATDPPNKRHNNLKSCLKIVLVTQTAKQFVWKGGGFTSEKGSF